MIIFVFLNLLASTILVIPNWNIEKTSINLLGSSNTKSYDITYRDMYGLKLRLEKTINKLDNGTIIHFNSLYSNATNEVKNVSFENIESFYLLDNNQILCPIGKYDPINLTKIQEITNNNKEKNDDFEIKCYRHNEGFFFVFYFRNCENQTYDLRMNNLSYIKYEIFQFYEELYDFKLVNKDINKNTGPYPICALAKQDNYIRIFGTSFNLGGDSIGKNAETNKTLIEAKTYSKGYFNNYTNDFYYITYNNISDFTSGHSTSTVLSYDDISPVIVSNNYNSPFEFLEEVEIKEMEFLLYTNYVYYSIINKISGKSYHGIFDVKTNKIVFNTDEDIDTFIPYSNYSMLAITKDYAYQICIIKSANSDSNFQCIQSCSGNIILDTDGNYCDNSCASGKVLLIPEEICISDCNTTIYIKNSSHCGLCRDMNSANKYKILDGENCIEEIPEGAEIYNADLYLLKCKSGYILEGSTCVPHCYENCYRCSEYSTDYSDQKCISCIDNHYLAGNAPNNCLFNCTGDNKIKCATCNNESNYLGLCLTCSNGYFNVNYTTLYPQLKYFDCLKEDDPLLKKFFLDEQSGEYKPCYKTCKRCEREGNEIAHYCLECESDYMFRPGNNPYNNCIADSSYYYISPYGQIKSMDILQCPEEAKYLIKDSSSCIYNCEADSTYKWLYNGNCVDQCPSGTQKVDYICLVDSNTCTLGTNDLILKNNSLDIINTYAKTYVSEFNYTNKHITQYINDNYTIILFKTASCIKELELELPYPDFKECYTKIQNAYNINESLLVSLVELKINLHNPITLFTFFHPISGEKLDSETICQNEKITLTENLLEILDEDSTFYSAQISLTDQGINIFDLSDPFFTDICFDFDNPLKKDIPLSSRIQDLYPNVSVCDKSCQYNGIDLDGMTASCDCTFNDIANNELLKDTILSDTLGQFFDFISSSNLQVFKCFQYMFKHFSRSIGGWISLFIIAVHIAMVLLYFIFELGKIKIYIFSLTKKYVEYISKINKQNNKNFPPKKVTLIDTIKGDKKNKKKHNKDNHHVKIFNPKKDNSDAKSVGEGLSKSKFHVKNSDDKKLITMGNNKKHFHLISSGSNIKIEKKEKKEKEEKIPNNNIILNHLSKNDTIKKEEKEKNSINMIIDLNTLSKNDISFFEEYLETSPDEMEYDEALYFDKRTFLTYFSECLKEKQIIAHTFIAKDNLKPRTMKIIVFSLNMLLYFVVNGLLFSEEVITELYELDEDEETFFSYFLRSIRRIIYSTLVSIVISIIVDFFFVGEDKLKHIYKKGKMSPENLKELVVNFINDISKRNISFIIVSSIILLFSFFYLLCFNYVYPYSQIEWIKSSITILIIMQFLSFFRCFCESGLRILSLRNDSEKLFKISQMID